MRITTKLRYGSMLLALVPALVVGTAIGWTAVGTAKQAMHENARSRLVALREDRAGQIERYLEMLSNQVLITAESVSTQRGLDFFKKAFAGYAEEVKPDIDAERQALTGFYTGPFLTEFSQRNSNASIDPAAYPKRLNESGIALQYRFIHANEHPVGSKDGLRDLGDGSDYARRHKFFHPTFRKLQQRSGANDIFLIDGETGHVVYSVFKGVDFATSLNDGAFADSGLGQAFEGAMAMEKPGVIEMTDIAPYAPAYRDPAAFMAAPVFLKGKKIGVIAFQVPLDGIRDVMTSGQRWEEAGLGKSGETYLVGADGTLRSESRAALQNLDGFAAMLEQAGADPASVAEIRSKKTAVGIRKIDSPGVRKALAGETGFEAFTDYRDEQVLSAYRPLEVLGMKWAIVSEMDSAEAYVAAKRLQSTIVYELGLIALLFIVISAIFGYLFSRHIGGPLNRIVRSMQNISGGSGDLTVRLDDSAKDELGDLSRAFNGFVATIDTLVGKVRTSTVSLSSSSEKLAAVTEDTRGGVTRQQGEIEHIATSVEELAGTVKEVAQSTAATAEAAEHAGTQVATGKGVLEENVTSIHELSSRMQASRDVVQALRDDSIRVGTVLDVIRSIAEQTNLLALNAAIEAARAGEQGRGFAVVADEVRVLAQRTQESTEEIREIIESLQSRSLETSEMLQSNNAELDSNVALSESTQEAFAEIERSVNELLGMSSQIARATEQQSSTTDEIGRNVNVIHDVAQATATGADQTAQASQDLAQLGVDLRKLVAQFKVSAA